MKKRILCSLLCLLLLSLAACGTHSDETVPPETVPVTAAPTEPIEETTIPAPTEPEWEPGTARAGIGEAVYRLFDAGTQLKILGTFRNYYVVEQEDVNLLVEQDMLRMEGEAAFEIWSGYARNGTEVFDNPYLREDAIATLNLNTPVTVLESSDSWAFIEWEGGTGYVKPEQISKWRITGGGGGSGGGGGGSDGTDVPIGSLSFTDGSAPRIRLLGAYYGPEMETATGMATVLADGTEGYICLLLRGDAVKVTEYDEECATVWLGDETYARIPRWLVKLEGDPNYEPWTGYSTWDGIVYEEYQLRTEKERLSTNRQVTVLDEVNGVYVVEYEGLIGYMLPDKVSESRISTGGGSSGGGGGDTWTPPQM